MQFALLNTRVRRHSYHYKTMDRTPLDYASSVWSSYKKKNVDKIEGIKQRVTKQLPALKDMSYPERQKTSTILMATTTMK